MIKLKRGKDLTILRGIIDNLLEQGKTTITEEEIEEQYKKMLDTENKYNEKKKK